MLGHAGDLDALMIGTRCNIHTPMAVKAASTGLPLYLEKPVAISQEQIAALRDAYRGREKSVVVSFPMRVTPLFQAVMEVVESGRLGVVNQVQAVNYVPYGGVYYARETYRDFDVTGGMWLQKATHDFDYLNALLGVPTAVSAVMTRKAYGGGMPHDLRCSACDRAGTCLESPTGVARRGDDGGVGTSDHLCVFGDGIELQDAGAALISYEEGTHASYTQNFLSRRSAGSRGATITGYQATLSFDWYVGTVRVRPSPRPGRLNPSKGDVGSPRRGRGAGAELRGRVPGPGRVAHRPRVRFAERGDVPRRPGVRAHQEVDAGGRGLLGDVSRPRRLHRADADARGAGHLVLTGMSALAACVTETAVTLQVPSPSPLVATDAGVSVA
jgi:predicted dehydrogenase